MKSLWRIGMLPAIAALTGCAGTDLYVVNDQGERLPGLCVSCMNPADKWILTTDANGHVEVPRGTTVVYITESRPLSLGRNEAAPLTLSPMTLRRNPEIAVMRPQAR